MLHNPPPPPRAYHHVKVGVELGAPGRPERRGRRPARFAALLPRGGAAARGGVVVRDVGVQVDNLKPEL